MFREDSLSPALASLRGALRLDSSRGSFSDDTAILKSAFSDDPTPAAQDAHGSVGDANYYLKLTTLFPAEALAIYGTGTAIFGTANVVVIFVGLLVLLTLRIVANREVAGSKVDWRAVAVAVASYLLWTTANDARWLVSLADGLSRRAPEIRQYAAFFGAALIFLAPVIAPPPKGGTR